MFYFADIVNIGMTENSSFESLKCELQLLSVVFCVLAQVELRDKEQQRSRAAVRMTEQRRRLEKPLNRVRTSHMYRKSMQLDLLPTVAYKRRFSLLRFSLPLLKLTRVSIFDFHTVGVQIG